jgi:hypothetical protein
MAFVKLIYDQTTTQLVRPNSFSSYQWMARVIGNVEVALTAMEVQLARGGRPTHDLVNHN